MLSVRNDRDFNAVVELVLNRRDSELEQGILFVDWPRYEITIQGPDFDGGIPTRIMPAFMEIQRVLNRAYARRIYGDEGRRLSLEDRMETNIVVWLRSGQSTKFGADVTEALNTMASKMSGGQSLAAVIVVAGMLAGVMGYKFYLTHQSRASELEVQKVMTAEETKRFEQLNRLIESNLDARASLRDLNRAHHRLSQALRDSDRVLLGSDVEPLSGSDARRLSRVVRHERVHERLVGSFRIETLYSGGVSSGYRARLRDVETGQVFNRVTIPEGALSTGQVEDLQNSEWNKSPLKMAIDVYRVGDRVVEVSLAEAEAGS